MLEKRRMKMRYEKPEVVSVKSALASVLGTKPGSPKSDNGSFETAAAYEADE